MRISTNSYPMDRRRIIKFGITIVLCITCYGRSMVVNGLSSYEKMGGKIPEEIVFYQGVQGKPGVDFPVFSRIPRTSFNCKEVESGYYADLETDCQVFHICNDGAKISFLCPNGTIFQQSDLICEWWFKVNCAESPNYYQESAEQLREDTERRKSLRKVINNIKYNVISKSQSKVTVAGSANSIVSTESSTRFATETRIEQLNGNRGQRKFNFNPPGEVSNSLSVGPTQPTHANSDETQVPEESASFYKSSQNTIQQVGKQVTINPYPNHRETYSDVPDIKYFYTQPLPGFTQSTSPASPQTRSTNRFPLNDGRPFVVTTPRIQYNINSFQGGGEVEGKTPVSSTEIPFRYSPTVPPVTVTSKSVFQSTPYSKVVVDSKLASPAYISKEDQLGVDINPNSGPSFSKIPQNVLDNINDDQKQVSSTPGPGVNTSAQHLDTASSISTTYLPSFDEKFVTPSPRTENIEQKSQQAAVNPNTDNNNFVRVTTIGTTSLPDHQIVIGHPKLIFNDDFTINPSLEDGNKYATSTPDYQIIIGHPKISFRPNTTDTLGEIEASFERAVSTTKFAQNEIDTSTPTFEKKKTTGESYSSPSYSTVSDFTPQNKPRSSAVTTASPSTDSAIIKIRVNNVSNVEDRFIAPPEPEVILKEYEQGTPLTDSDVFKVSINGQINSEETTDKDTPSKTTRRNGFYLTKQFTSGAESTTLPSTASSSANTYLPESTIKPSLSEPSTTSSSANTYLPKSTTKPPLSEPSTASSSANTYLPKSTTKPPLLDETPKVSVNFVVSNENVLPQKTSAGVAQPPDVIIRDETSRPKPFELPPKTNSDIFAITTVSPLETDVTFEPNPRVYVSSARPFSSNTLETVPTLPTEFTTEKSSIYEHVHNMINTLREIADEEKDKGGEGVAKTSRPGLLIPPSAGPQSLHSLAVYFANALDNITTTEGPVNGEGDTEDESEAQAINELLTRAEGPVNGEDVADDENEAQTINELLTRATLNRYHELFKEDDDEEDDITTHLSASKGEDADSFDNDLLGEHSKNPTVTPRVHQLAQAFTKALSSYLDNPETFKKALQEIRPTEPPAITSTVSRVEDDELLNYSDADIVPGLLRLTTTTSVSPTWGYILAPNNSNSFEYNSLSSDGENLQSADSQSFATQFNNLVKDKIQKQLISTSPKPDSPNGHWTSSPAVTGLWRDALYTPPLTINRNLSDEIETTQPPVSSIDYELRALPKLSLNSTQVHGLLIDFMNSSTPDDSNKLHRILEKLNTTQDEFLAKMRAIEQNPITRRLILLLISECGSNTTEAVETRTTTVQEVLSSANVSDAKITPVVDNEKSVGVPSPFQVFVDPSLRQEDDDTRALQLLNALYSISSKFGK